MNRAQRQATNRLDALIAQFLRRRKPRLLIQIGNDERFLIAPNVTIDRFLDRDFGRLYVRPSFLAAFEEIRTHHVSLLVVQHDGKIAERKKISQTTGYLVEELGYIAVR